MYNFTCPKCGLQHKSENLRAGAVLACKKCQQPMRVVFADESAPPVGANERPASKGRGPLLVGAGALAGVTIGGLILFLSSFLAAKPAQNAQAPPPAVPKPAEEAPSKDDHVLKGDPGPKSMPGPMSSDDIYEEMLKSAVWIHATDGKEVWTGSGSVIDRDERLVLTNEHVANRRCKKILVVFPIHRDGKLLTERSAYEAEIKEQGIKATLVEDRAICDLALIRLEKLPKGVKAHRLSKRKLRPGQSLHTVGGSPKGNQGMWISSSGAVRQILTSEWSYGDGFRRKAQVIASSVPINSGDSGGAVVDGRGILVGVNALSSGGVLNSGHIHVSEVRSFLHSAYQGMGKQFTEPAAEAAGATPDAVAKWIKALKAPESVDRVRAAAALEKIGPDAQKAAPDLLRLVQNPTEVASVRRAAAQALNEIGAPPQEHFKLVLAALVDKKCHPARRYAASSLGAAPEDCRTEAIKALAKALKDDDAKVRENAATALGGYGKAVHDDAYADLLELLRDAELKVRDAAYNTLLKGGPPEQVDVAQVKDLLEGEKEGKKPTDEARYWGVFLVVQNLKEKGLPLLMEALDKEENFKDKVFVKYVVLQLRKFKLNSPEVGTILSKAMDHREESVQWEVIDALPDLGFGENTVEAYIKLYANGQKLLDKEARKTGKKARTFGDNLYEMTTFSRGGGLGFKISSKMVGALIKGVEATEINARLLSVLCLRAIGKEAAEAAPTLGGALLKEKSSVVRIEILAALAALGEAGGTKLDDNKEVEAELERWVSDARADNHVPRVLAALAVASLYPGQEKASKAYRVLARALLLTNGPITLDLVQRTRFGVRVAPLARAAANATDKELHERAKQALSKGGVTAGDAIHEVFESSFWSSVNDKLDVICDKLHARRCAFQVLAKIGPPLKDVKKPGRGSSLNPYRRLIDKVIKYGKQGKEDNRVIDAAREAQIEIFKK